MRKGEILATEGHGVPILQCIRESLIRRDSLGGLPLFIEARDSGTAWGTQNVSIREGV